MSFALITGSGKRIGASIALHLAKNNWGIILHYFNSKTEAALLQKQILEMGVKCKSIQADLSKPFDVFNNLPEVKLLINNAAIFKNDNISSISQQKMTEHFSVNLIAPTILSSQFTEKLQSSNNTGNIINILDYSIYKIPHNFLSYSLSKYALAYLTKILAKQLAPKVRVNGIALGQVLKNTNQSEENFIQAINANPLKNKIKTEEICKTIDFIIKTNSITGQIINLDSGMHLSDEKYQ